MGSLGRFLRRWIVVASIAAAVGSLCAFGGRWWWWLELCTHFRPQYFAALAAGAVACLTLKQRFFATLFAVGAAYNLALIVPLYVPADATADNRKPIRLLVANLLARNEDPARFLRLASETSPDLIVAIEVDSDWLDALEQVAASYPHQIKKPREDSFGIAVFSRLPAEELRIRSIGPAGVPSVFGRFDLGAGEKFCLVATHPLPPVSARKAALRNEQLLTVGQFAATLPEPTVLAGDLNTTSWSPCFCDLLAVSGLRDSRRGFGIQPTWPGRFASIGIPIDHVLVSPEIAVVHRAVGPHIGSDHRPVVIDIVVRGRRDREPNAVLE
jgi:endonuclease/exonuclease/phosphatase (EEP) superfamily protein YafD